MRKVYLSPSEDLNRCHPPRYRHIDLHREEIHSNADIHWLTHASDVKTYWLRGPEHHARSELLVLIPSLLQKHLSCTAKVMPPPRISFFRRKVEPMQNEKLVPLHLSNAPREYAHWLDLYRSVSLVLAGSRCILMQPFHQRLGVDAEINIRSTSLLPPDELIAVLHLLKARSIHLKHSLYYWTLKCCSFPWWHILFIWLIDIRRF